MNATKVLAVATICVAFTATSVIVLGAASQDTKRTPIDELAQTIVPIGGVIPYFGDPSILPDTWQVCDNSPLRENADQGLRQRLAPKDPQAARVPDLNDRFLRGTTVEANNCGTSGRASFSASGTTAGGGKHSHDVKPHSHPLPDSTGAIATGGSNPGDRKYAVTDNGGQWKTGHIVVSGGLGGEGDHRHDLGGSTSNDNGTKTDEEPDHPHPFSVSGDDVVPAHTYVLYIMRIR